MCVSHGFLLLPLVIILRTEIQGIYCFYTHFLRTHTGNATALAYYGDACDVSQPPAQNITGRYALVDRSGDCSYFQKLNNSAWWGAVGVIVYTDAQNPVEGVLFRTRPS